MCADAHNEKLMVRFWDLGVKNLASWPDKLKRSISKRRYLVKSTSEWRTLLTLLGFKDKDSDNPETAEGNDEHDTLKGKFISKIVGKGWKGSKFAETGWNK
jgi:hypothetical protein